MHAEIPAIERVGARDEAFQVDEIWIPYPQLEPVVEVDFGRFANLHYDLHEVGAAITNMLSEFDDQRHLRSNKLVELNEKFATIHDSLPQIREDRILDPHIMDLRCVFVFILDLCTKAL